MNIQGEGSEGAYSSFNNEIEQKIPTLNGGMQTQVEQKMEILSQGNLLFQFNDKPQPPKKKKRWSHKEVKKSDKNRGSKSLDDLHSVQSLRGIKSNKRISKSLEELLKDPEAEKLIGQDNQDNKEGLPEKKDKELNTKSLSWSGYEENKPQKSVLEGQIPLPHTSSDPTLGKKSTSSIKEFQDLNAFIKKKYKEFSDAYPDHFLDLDKEIKKIVYSQIDSWSHLDKDQLEQSSMSSLTKILESSDLLLKVFKLKLVGMRLALNSFFKEYKDPGISQDIIYLINACLELEKAKTPSEFLAIIDSNSDEKIQSKIIEMIGGKKSLKELRERREFISAKLIKFIKQDLYKLVIKEVNLVLKKELESIHKKFPTDCDLCHLNTFIQDYIEKLLAEKSNTELKDLSIFQDSIIKDLIVLNSKKVKPLLLSAGLRRLEEIQNILTKYQEENNLVNHPWITSLHNTLLELNNLGSNPKKFMSLVESLEDKSLVLKILGGDKILESFKKWKELVITKVHDSLCLYQSQRLILMHYSIVWQEKKNEKISIDSIQTSNITRSICEEEGKGYLFNTLKIESNRRDKSIQVEKIDKTRFEVFKDILKALQQCGWDFQSDNLDELAKKIISGENLPISSLLKGMTSIPLKHSVLKNEKDHYHQDLYAKKPYWTVPEGANGGSVDCTIRVYEKNQASIIREFTDVIYAFDPNYLTDEDKSQLREATGNEQGRGYEICKVRRVYSLLRLMDEQGNVSWKGETRINKFEFLKGVSYQIKKDIIKSYLIGVPSNHKNTIAKPDIKAYKKKKDASYNRSNMDSKTVNRLTDNNV